MSQISSSVDSISSSSSGELDTTESSLCDAPSKNDSYKKNNRSRSVTPLIKESRKRKRSQSISKSKCYKGNIGNCSNFEQKNVKPSKCIGVFGMRRETTSRIVEEYFHRYGPIEDIRIIRDYYSRESKGFCFIKFEKLSHAKDALEGMNGKNIEGKCVRVDYAIPKSESKWRNYSKEERRYERKKDHNYDYYRERYKDNYRKKHFRNRAYSFEKYSCSSRRRRHYSSSTNCSYLS